MKLKQSTVKQAATRCRFRVRLSVRLSFCLSLVWSVGAVTPPADGPPPLRRPSRPGSQPRHAALLPGTPAPAPAPRTRTQPPTRRGLAAGPPSTCAFRVSARWSPRDAAHGRSPCPDSAPGPRGPGGQEGGSRPRRPPPALTLLLRAHSRTRVCVHLFFPKMTVSGGNAGRRLPSPAVTAEEPHVARQGALPFSA